MTRRWAQWQHHVIVNSIILRRRHRLLLLLLLLFQHLMNTLMILRCGVQSAVYFEFRVLRCYHVYHRGLYQFASAKFSAYKCNANALSSRNITLCIYTVSEKNTITSQNIDRFLKLFHWHTLRDICNEVDIKFHRTWNALQHYLVKRVGKKN